MFRRSTAIILASLSLTHSAGAAVVALSTPSGLAVGTKFRFLFVTSSTVNGWGTSVGDYDSFVTTNAGGATYNGSVVSWKAIASTSTVDARDNVGGYGDDVAVYLVNGTKIANNMTTGSGGLWSGTLLTTPNINISSGTQNTAAFTGSNADGTKSGNVLGSTTPMAGNSARSNTNWLSTQTFSRSTPLALYGVSQELTVVPAPGAIAVLGIAGLAGRRRRR